MLDPGQITRWALESNSDADDHTTLPCFMCGRSMLYRDARFCCDRCRNFYDAGNDPDRPAISYHWRDGLPMRPGPDGFLIACAHCRKEFNSRGLRCCSTECERAHFERQDNLMVLAAVGIEPATKQKCEHCEAPIPAWRKGRRVSGKVKFCSRKCQQQSFRGAAIEAAFNKGGK